MDVSIEEVVAMIIELVVLGAIGREIVAGSGPHATQRTWPTVRLQLGDRIFQEYKSVSVIPNFVQIE
jgi:hypothetical protein